MKLWQGERLLGETRISLSARYPFLWKFPDIAPEKFPDDFEDHDFRCEAGGFQIDFSGVAFPGDRTIATGNSSFLIGERPNV